MKKYERIKAEEREEIMKLLAAGKSYREIGKKLKRSPSSISREIRRNKKGKKGDKDRKKIEYSAIKAQEKAEERQRNSHKKFVLKSYVIRYEVERKLEIGWSPEIISGWLKREGIGEISAESIYKYIFKYKKHLIGCLMRYRKDKRYEKRGSYKKSRVVKQPEKVNIAFREKQANKREEIGHWETDIIEGKGKSSLKVCVDRKSRLTIISKTANKSAEESNEILIKIFRDKKYKIKTMTYDNGSENSGYKKIEQILGIKSYFCNPYHSWEKGTVENTNGLIRIFFPKGTNFDNISQAQIDMVSDWLNNRPRKCLNFLTPKEVFFSSPVALAT